MINPTIPPFLSRILDRAGGYFQMDLRYFARGTFWGVVSQVATVASSIALSVAMSRFVPKEIYGEYKYILSLVALLPILSLTGLGAGILPAVARGYDGALSQAFRTNLRWSFAMFAGALAMSLYYFYNHNIDLAVGMLLGGSLSPIITSASFASIFLAAKKDWARQALYGSILGSLGPTLSLIVTVLLTHNVIILVAVYFISNVLTDLLLYWLVLRVYRPDRSKQDPSMLSYAKHMSFMGILGAMAANLDQILLFHFVGPTDLALYSFAKGIPDQIKGPLKNLDSMLQARFANHLPKDIRDNMRTKSLFLLAFTLVSVGLYIPLAPFFYHLLYPNYADAIPYSQIYMLSFLALPFSASGSYLAAKKLVREQYISTVFTSVLQIGLMAVGVIGWGLWGLVWSIVIVRISTGITWYILFRYASAKESAV